MSETNNRKETRTMKESKRLRQESAKARKLLRDKKSPQEQLADLDSRLGKDVGAKKERARLLKLIADGVSKKVVETLNKKADTIKKDKKHNKRFKTDKTFEVHG